VAGFARACMQRLLSPAVGGHHNGHHRHYQHDHLPLTCHPVSLTEVFPMLGPRSLRVRTRFPSSPHALSSRSVLSAPPRPTVSLHDLKDDLFGCQRPAGVQVTGTASAWGVAALRTAFPGARGLWVDHSRCTPEEVRHLA
jgi:hypothetical protein